MRRGRRGQWHFHFESASKVQTYMMVSRCRHYRYAEETSIMQHLGTYTIDNTTQTFTQSSY